MSLRCCYICRRNIRIAHSLGGLCKGTSTSQLRFLPTLPTFKVVKQRLATDATQSSLPTARIPAQVDVILQNPIEQRESDPAEHSSSATDTQSVLDHVEQRQPEASEALPDTLQQTPEGIILRACKHDPDAPSDGISEIDENVHEAAQQLLHQEWLHESTVSAMGMYLRAICGTANAALRRAQLLDAHRLRRHVWLAAETATNPPPARAVPEGRALRLQAEGALKTAIDVFRAAKRQPNLELNLNVRVVGYFLDTLARATRIDVVEEVVAYYRDRQSVFPLSFYPLVAAAYIRQPNIYRLMGYRKDFFEALQKVRPDDIVDGLPVTRRVEIVESDVYVEEKIETLEDLQAELEAYWIQGLFRGREPTLAYRRYKKILEHKIPGRKAAFLAFLTGKMVYEQESIVNRLHQIKRNPELRPYISDGLVFRSLLHAALKAAPNPARYPIQVVNEVYAFLLEVSVKNKILHAAAELALVVNANIVATLRASQAGSTKEALEMIKTAFDFWKRSGQPILKSRIIHQTSDLDSGSGLSRINYRLSHMTTKRFCNALALLGLHTKALDVWNDLMQYQEGLEPGTRPMGDALALFKIGLIALGAEAEGAKPSMAQILTVWSAQSDKGCKTPWLAQAAENALPNAYLSKSEQELYDSLAAAKVVPADTLFDGVLERAATPSEYEEPLSTDDLAPSAQ